MKRQCVVMLVMVPIGTAVPALVAGDVRAQTPLEPVQYVYPDSSHADIQQALDSGGTVYFDRLTSQTRQYGEYNQLADEPWGFHVGAMGRDVHVIGLLGPNGERPRINGGKVVFRAGRNPILGLFGLLPVSFKIENLELFHPDLATPFLASRIGIWVTALGARSVVNNCRITIIGNTTDPNHANNHSVGIWFWVVSFFGAAPPPSGATIDVTNNTIIGIRIHEGLHIDSFWQIGDDFIPPRPVIANNKVDVTMLGGFPNGGGTNGATLVSAVLVAGDLHSPVLTGNTIRGDGRSSGVTPPVEATAIGLTEAGSLNDVLDGAMVVGNDSSGFTGDFQIWMDPGQLRSFVPVLSEVSRRQWGHRSIGGKPRGVATSCGCTKSSSLRRPILHSGAHRVLP